MRSSPGDVGTADAERAEEEDEDEDEDEEDHDASLSSHPNHHFLYVQLHEIRKEVQCAICLGIIRKTRTVMECLHRFCRDCINKSMRLGNNECPACRTHCASRRSLRDDPNFDALISMLYPDIDKFEQEELSFNEEEKQRNKMIQDSIAETFRRQSEVAVKRSNAKSPVAANARRPRKRGRSSTQDVSPSGSDNEERRDEQENIEVNAEINVTPSPEEQSPPPEERPKKRRKSRQSSEARTAEKREISETGNLQDSLNSSLLIAWGRNGTRSRHPNSTSGSNGGRASRNSRLTKLIEHLRDAEQENSELNLNIILVPLNGTNSPKMEKPYVSCQSSVSISHLCHLVSMQTSCTAKDVEIYMMEESAKKSSSMVVLAGEKSLKEILPFACLKNGELELLYAVKSSR